MMNCAAGCVNKLAFLTEAGQHRWTSLVVMHRAEWLQSRRLSTGSAHLPPPVEGASGVFFLLTAAGGDWELGLSLLIPASRWNQSGLGAVGLGAR